MEWKEAERREKENWKMRMNTNDYCIALLSMLPVVHTL